MSARLVIWGALFGLMACSGGPARYRLARPELFDNAGATDRHCVFDDEAPSWQPGRLTAMTCSAWSRRGDFDAVPGQWLFFPNLALGSTTRGISRCPDCKLTVTDGGQRGRWSIRLRAGADPTALAHYRGRVADGLFHGPGRLTLQRGEICRGYCKDGFVAEGQLADQITLEGRFASGVLVAPFKVTYALGEQAQYEGGARHDPVKGVIPHGEGRRTAADGALQAGTWRDGKLHGEGEERLPDGTHYRGGFRAGIFHGEGVLERPGGARYEGEFQAGKRHGQGTQALPDGTHYQGTFAQDQRTGQGTLRTPDGAVYAGQFLHDRRHGQGEQRQPDGATYEGEWRADQRHGAGRLTAPDGVVQAGQWVADALQPDEVQISWPGGPYQTYVGPLQDGRPHGVGTLRWRDGLEYAGEFLHGRMAGQGALRWPDGHEYIGQWAEGRPEGCGLHRGPEGLSWVGAWVDGVPRTLGCRAVPTDQGPIVGALGQIPLSDLFTALKAQRRSAARRAARKALPTVRERHRVAALSRPPARHRPVVLGFSWAQGPLRRLVHPTCLPPATLSVRAGDAPLTAELTGLLDVEAVVHLPVGSTRQVCVDFEGPCGASRGCTSVDVPSDEAREPVFTRILLELPSPATPAN